MAKRDPHFNDFLRNFKAKNETNWASIVDMTQEDQEEALLAKSPEYRKNEMVMLEEFRRRKQFKDFYDIRSADKRQKDEFDGLRDKHWKFKTREKETHLRASNGPERWFEPQWDEVFNPKDFTLIFVDSDSVTNVTTLNRIN